MYSLKFPSVQMRCDTGKISFSIGNMKCRKSCVVEVILHFFNNRNVEQDVMSYRWVVDKDYRAFSYTFNINNNEDVNFVQVELCVRGVTSENPLWFTECMLEDGEHTEYHAPEEYMPQLSVDFIDNCYANLYNNDGSFLQVIRPNKEPIFTHLIPRTTKWTILAPHLPDETSWDNPINIFYEAMTQKEQTISVER